MNAVRKNPPARLEMFGHALVGGDHEFLDQTVAEQADSRIHQDFASFLPDADFRNIEIKASAPDPAAQKCFRQFTGIVHYSDGRASCRERV